MFFLILEGKTDNFICQQLGISISGVRRHKEKMLICNNCKNILQLIGKYYDQFLDSNIQ